MMPARGMHVDVSMCGRLLCFVVYVIKEARQGGTLEHELTVTLLQPDFSIALLGKKTESHLPLDAMFLAVAAFLSLESTVRVHNWRLMAA